MSQAFCVEHNVAKKQSPGRRGGPGKRGPEAAEPRRYVQFLCDPDWRTQLEKFAERAGMDVSAYCRNAIIRQMAKDSQELGPLPQSSD